MKKNKKTMTLIELLIVMTIIGILALVAIPRYTGARLAAEHSLAMHNVALIAQAEKIAQIQNAAGVFVATSSGDLNTDIGAFATPAACRGDDNCSGIDLTPVDADTRWTYDVTVGGTITGTKVGGLCGGGTFTYNLNTNSFTTLDCS